jgi:hypothetical protein
MEEEDERAFLFFAQLRSNRHHLLGVIPEADCLSEGRIIRGDPLPNWGVCRRLGEFAVVQGDGRHALVKPLSAMHRSLDVCVDGDDHGRPRDLQGAVCIVHSCRELIKRRTAKDGVVGKVEVRHVKDNVKLSRSLNVTSNSIYPRGTVLPSVTP